MTEEPAESSRKSSNSEKISHENKKNVSLVLLVAAWFIAFLWPFAIAVAIGMFPKSQQEDWHWSPCAYWSGHSRSYREWNFAE
jgi:hypothetical protein